MNTGVSGREEASKPTIVLAVTVDQSLRLLHGQPQFLADRGWSVHVVSAGDTRRPAEDFVGRSRDVTFHQLPMTRNPSLWLDLGSLVRWVCLLRRIGPDVICVGTPKASLLSLIAARALRVPNRVYLVRGLRFEAAKGVARRMLIAVERVTCMLSTQAIAVSPSVKAVMVAERISRSHRVTVLGCGSSNGVAVPDPTELGRLRATRTARRRDLGLADTSPIVGFVGRLTRDKGVLDLAQACAHLVASGVDVQLLLVGDDDSEGRVVPQVSAILDEASVPHKLTGYVANPTAVMSVMDIFCLPSFREGLPNVTLEAAAWGLPVVTTDATGCRDSVIPGVSGIIYSTGKSAELVSSLTRLVKSEDLRAAMGSAGADWVRECFTRDVVWERYEQFYRGLICACDQETSIVGVAQTRD